MKFVIFAVVCGVLKLVLAGVPEAAVLGCPDPGKHSLKDELCPTNIDELVSLSADELERFYNLALKYRPGAVNLTRLASRRVIQIPKGRNP